jgi:hypothetical protein
MNGIRFHDLSVRYSIAFLAAVFSTCLYSCSGGAVSPKESSENPKTPIAKHDSATSKPAPKSDQPSFHFVKPAHVKGMYWTAWTGGSHKAREKLLAIIDKTELNSVVVDIRDEGTVYLRTKIPMANEPKVTQLAISKPNDLLKSLEDHKVWPIARIACFRDNFVTINHPELSIHFANGSIWHDRKGYHWLDPYNKKNWEYIGQIVDFALDLGFPEIQLDYVRFPSEGKAASQVFPAKKAYGKADENSADVISAFTKYIGDKVHARHAVYSVDIFGIISSMKGDEGIGQQLEKVAAPFDVLSPMIYPSHFALGEYGIKNPNASPYEIIKKSLNDYKKRLPKTIIRPWLQAFSLNHIKYTAVQLKAQIKATREVGYQGFLLWNAGNKYPYLVEALGPKDPKDLEGWSNTP